MKLRMLVLLIGLTATESLAVESAVYMQSGSETSAPKSSGSLLRQWTEPPPTGASSTAGAGQTQGSRGVEQVAVGPLRQMGQLGQFGRGLSGQPSYGQNTPVLPPSPAQLPPGGYGASPSQTVPSMGGRMMNPSRQASGLVTGSGPSVAGGAQAYSGYTGGAYQTPAYTEVGAAKPGSVGAANVGKAVAGSQPGMIGNANPYQSPYGSSGGSNAYGGGYGYAPHGGSYQGASAAASVVPTDHPFDSSGGGDAGRLPAPSAAAGLTPSSDPYSENRGYSGTPAYYPPVSSGGFDGMWGSQPVGSNGYDPCAIASSQDYVEGGSFPSSSSFVPASGGGPQTWGRADVLFGWLNGYDTPALLTRNPVGTEIESIGDLSSGQTRTIFGGRNFGDDVRFGGRLMGGHWFDSCRRWGIQADVLALGNDDEDFRTSSLGDPILSRPFYNTDPAYDGPDAQVLALENIATGSFRSSTSGRLVSVGTALRFNICSCGDPCPVECPPCDPCDPCSSAASYSPSGWGGIGGGMGGGRGLRGLFGGGCGSGGCGLGGGGAYSRVDLIAGYRYLQLQEEFTAREVLTPTGTNFAADTTFTLDDVIDTQNDFHAFELGAIWQLQRGPLLWDFAWSAAFGELTRHYTTNGSTTFGVPGTGGVDETVSGGFLVRPENIGSFKDSKFTVMPQARIGLGYSLRRNTRLHVGYTFLYLDNVFRPGSLMSDRFDGRTLGIRPADGIVGTSVLPTRDESVFLHALSLGLSCNY